MKMPALKRAGALLLALLAGSAANAQTVAITGGTVALGDGSEPIPGGTVIVRDGRIVAAGRGVAAAGVATRADRPDRLIGDDQAGRGQLPAIDLG